MIVIPPSELDPQILTALIEDFVTREGAVHGHSDVPMEQMIATVRKQLLSGIAQIAYDEAEETWTIVARDRR